MEPAFEYNLQMDKRCQHGWRTGWIVCIHLQQPQLGRRDAVIVTVKTPALQQRVRVPLMHVCGHREAAAQHTFFRRLRSNAREGQDSNAWQLQVPEDVLSGCCWQGPLQLLQVQVLQLAVCSQG